jgi:predicted nucleic acid-binding protein
MRFLLDTCVVSELIKSNPDRNVIMWIRNEDENDLFLSVITFGEIRKGIDRLAKGRKRTTLSIWLEKELKQRFSHRIIPIDISIAERWGAQEAKNFKAGKPMPVIDGLLASTAEEYELILVTRNEKDFENSSIKIFNPWTTPRYK